MTIERREDWAIKRRQGVGFTAPELATIRIGFENDRPVRDVAREIGASIRCVRERYARLRAKAELLVVQAEEAPPAPPAPAPPKSRFYKSNFEL